MQVPDLEDDTRSSYYPMRSMGPDMTTDFDNQESALFVEGTEFYSLLHICSIALS
jgi:hypothetical protein